MIAKETIHEEAGSEIPTSYLRIMLPVIVMVLLFTACSKGREEAGGDMQRGRGRMDTTYEAMQGRYKALMSQYNKSEQSMPEEMSRLYGQMQWMRQRMDSSRQMMMGRNMGRGRDMKGGKRMSDDRGMGMDKDRKKGMSKDKREMRKGMGMDMGKGRGRGMSPGMMGRMTGEWYEQMRSMHERMGQMHQQMGQKSIAQMHERMAEGYGRMKKDLPETDEKAELPAEEEEDIEEIMAKGRNIYSQNCASCHGSEGQGRGSAFPPLINSKWVTAEKSVPIRILLHGLSGDIEVGGRAYQGNMPSFKARLSAAEMAATLNYIRSESEGDFPQIKQEDVVQVNEEYEGRDRAWSGDELGVE